MGVFLNMFVFKIHTEVSCAMFSVCVFVLCLGSELFFLFLNCGLACLCCDGNFRVGDKREEEP